jgi:hypothetical protein
MSLKLALVIVAAISLVGNRILSLLVGLLLRVPAVWLLPMVYVLDLIQIPFFYWLYEHSATVLDRLPPRVRSWFGKDWSSTTLGQWTSSLGSLGVFLVAILPTFGGGMWSAVFIAYGLNLRKSWSYLLMALGSLVSILCLFWVLDTLVRTFRYFCPT